MNIKTVIVTGASGSIGKEIVRNLAINGYRVILACRNLEKGNRVIEELKSTCSQELLLPSTLNLASVHSILKFIESLQKRNESPDILINNAGIMCKYYTQTEDKIETTLATNYLGPYLLTRLLLPLMNPAQKQIINTISCTCRIGNISRNFFEITPQNYGRFKVYANSKLALLLFSQEILSRYAIQNVHVAVADPGVVNTPMITMQAWFDPLADILFRPFIKTPQQGAQAILSAVNDTSHSQNLFIHYSKRRKEISKSLGNCFDTKWLWEATEQLCYSQFGIRFPGL